MNLQAISSWIVERSLGELELGPLFDELCERLCAEGLPLLRSHITMPRLHPLVQSADFTWWRERGMQANEHPFSSDPDSPWLRSPLRWMLEERISPLRIKLDEPGDWSRFPILQEFNAAGASDYVAFTSAFGDPETAIERRDGVITSWVCDRVGGFTSEELEQLEAMQSPLALAAKVTNREETARNVVAAYLGADPGRRVLDGQIRLGDLERIPAAIWFSDLRDSSAMADSLSAEAFIKLLNIYFECTAGAVLDNGGEVLRFVGDAVLAIFPIHASGSATAAAKAAWAAAQDASRRMEVANKQLLETRTRPDEQPLRFGLGLHLGDVHYGNIGVATRVEFSVIGPTANEAARLESLTKSLGETVVVSSAFRDALPIPWRSLGAHQLAGVRQPQEVFVPD